MVIDTRAAFALEVQRLEHAGLAVPASVRGVWGLLMVAEVALLIAIAVVGLMVGGLALALPVPPPLAFIAGAGIAFVAGLKARREALRVAYRTLAARLERPAPGAVGGVTSAGFPALFSAPPPPSPPPRQHDVVKVVRVGDLDAEDFDD